jgi:hypothetical protein
VKPPLLDLDLLDRLDGDGPAPLFPDSHPDLPAVRIEEGYHLPRDLFRALQRVPALELQPRVFSLPKG